MGSERRGRAVHGRLEVNPSGEEPTDRPRQKNAELWEPYDGRLSRTVLREREGEVPSRHSPGMLREAVEHAYPYNRRMRLFETPPSRSQNWRFRKKYVTDDLLEAMHKRIELAAYQAMSALGMLEPPQESLTHPDPYSFLTGDGCWLPAWSSLTRDDAVDPETGEIVGRYDPDALAYHTHEGKASSPGHLLVMVQARNPHPKERIVATTRLKSAHNPEVNRNDATIAVTAVLELCERFPQMRQAFVGIVYDMALSTADFDRLLDEGLIAVSKVPLTSQGEVAAENLGPHDFKTKDGQPHTRIVTAVNGRDL